MPCNMKAQQDKENTTPPRDRSRLRGDVSDREQGNFARTPNSAPLAEETSRNRADVGSSVLPESTFLGTDRSLFGSGSEAELDYAFNSDSDFHDSSEERVSVPFIESPFMFPSFISNVNLLLGPDSVFASLHAHEGSARTSPQFAERYRRRVPLPPISTLLRPRTLPDSESHQAQFAHCSGAASTELKHGETGSDSSGSEADSRWRSCSSSTNSVPQDNTSEESAQRSSHIPLDSAVAGSMEAAHSQAPRCTSDEHSSNMKSPEHGGL
ncbi:hypothetical protein RRG08_048390 [Elysia crispata]|uniref:Uncharacterized protein n=1 Tax=Elysia crispata TaxID=231223 RepID=A0AAE1B8U3_9GAST|nr:hypothetical protein RRG08_048390 [Elysia crispata]